MPTREDILNTLAQEHEKVLARYRMFTPEELETNCTKSETPNGEPWRPKDHLTHLVRIERAFQGMAKRTLEGAEDPVGFSRMGARNREEALPFIHQNNQVNVEAHRNDSLETLLADLTNARNETLTLIAQLTDEQLTMPIPGAPWGDGTIGGVLMASAQHATRHLAWVEEGLATHSH